MDYKYDLNANSKMLLGFQTIYQSAVNLEEMRIQAKPILKKNGNSQSFGGRIAWQNKSKTLNYNR
jgi:hypothetical protein